MSFRWELSSKRAVSKTLRVQCCRAIKLVLAIATIGVLLFATPGIRGYVWQSSSTGVSGGVSSAIDAVSSPRADIVLVLDATMSMGDEIEDVKTNIMSIGSRLAYRKPQPDVRFGAVFYRDVPSSGIPEGELVRVVPLSHDLQSVRQAILDVRVIGNRDWPEHVGIGLHKALQMNWSHSAGIGGTRLLYLIGDAPPQEHDDGYDVQSALDIAKDKGVKIHAIGCSGIELGPKENAAFYGKRSGIETFAEIAEATGGTFTRFDRRQYQLRQEATKNPPPRPRPRPSPLADLLARTGQGTDAERRLEGPVIGIDLGTTHSSVGIYKDGRVEIIPNSDGIRRISSDVGFIETGVFINEDAELGSNSTFGQVVSNVKRLIGRRYHDPMVQRDIMALPYPVAEVNGKPVINVTFMGEQKLFRPEELSAKVLMRLKDIAQNYLGKEVRNAVLTVPANFNDAQRQATKDAGTIAGLNVLRIINEPTAAAIAYGLDEKDEHNILVYDLGGGTLDVSLLTIDNGVFEVVATSGDTHLGGADFDQRVIEHILQVCKSKYNIDVETNVRAMRKVGIAARQAKHHLSKQTVANIDLPELYAGIDVSMTLTRAKFEQLNADLFDRALIAVQNVLEQSGLNQSQVDEVVLVGGTSKIPKIQSLLRVFFNGKQLNTGIRTDEAIAYGAAVQAGVLSGEGGQDLLLLDVTPLTVGFEGAGGVMVPIIKRNTVVPTKKSSVMSTWEDNQPAVNVRIYEGERPMVKDNHLLGEFSIAGIPPAPRGQPQIELTFEIDSDGILNVHGQDRATGKSEKTTITNDKGRLTEEQIENMIKEAETFASSDSVANARQWARTALSEYLSAVRAAAEGSNGFETFSGKLDIKDKYTLHEALSSATQWLLSNPAADTEEIKSQHSTVEATCTPLLLKYDLGHAVEDDEHSSFSADNGTKILTDVLFDSIRDEL